jgi:pimeloyl-ACP methyl ester carboxylesterase
MQRRTHERTNNREWPIRLMRCAGLAAMMTLPLLAQSRSMHEGYAELSGVRLWYRDSGGAGVPVVFLHAATGSSGVWEHQENAFVSAGFRFIAYDRRGFGRTVVEPSGTPSTTGADDLDALMKHLRIDRFHLVGTAAGAFVCLDYALSFPQRLRSVVIANTVGGVQDEEYVELGRRLRPPAFAAMPPELRELGPSYRASNPAGTQRWIDLERTNRPGSNAGTPSPTQPMRNRITFALLETLKVPALLVTGDADLYAPPAVMRLFAARIKGAESVVVPEAGHSAYWEQPDIFNRTVLTFIGKH